jgi:hypothetical protein
MADLGDLSDFEIVEDDLGGGFENWLVTRLYL